MSQRNLTASYQPFNNEMKVVLVGYHPNPQYPHPSGNVVNHFINKVEILYLAKVDVIMTLSFSPKVKCNIKSLIFYLK